MYLKIYIFNLIQLIWVMGVSNFDHYLGIPLFFARITTNMSNCLVDCVQQQISSWKTRAISQAIRITLIQMIWGLSRINPYFWVVVVVIGISILLCEMRFRFANLRNLVDWGFVVTEMLMTSFLWSWHFNFLLIQIRYGFISWKQSKKLLKHNFGRTLGDWNI